jgi:uncharacterized RDD family membrane protein YckC
LDTTAGTARAGEGVGIRAVATIIDGVILYIVFFLIAVITGENDGASFAMGTGGTCAALILSLAYFTVMEVMMGGTVGKLVTGLQVVKEDGSPITWQEGIIRTLLRIVDGLFIYLIAAILVWTSPTKQRLGDRVAKTLVVKKGSVASIASPTQRF